MEFQGYEGARLAAWPSGDPEGPAVLLLGPPESWREAAEALAAAGRYAIRLSPRSASEPRHDLDARRGDLRAVLETLGSRPVVIADGASAAAAVTALGEGGEQLATGLVLVGRGAVDAVDARVETAAASVAVPTLALCAPATGRLHALARLIPGSVEASADAGALAAADQADALNAQLLDFLERAAPRTAPEYRAGSDPRTLRDALGCFGTGVTVVTTRGPEGQPAGLTANSFTSVSLDPPLLLVCLANTASSLPAFAAADAFAVNVLHIGQQTVSGRFSKRAEDRFAATPWETWDTGAPIIANSLASFECTRHAWHEAGDHVILVGRVGRVRFEPRRDPLLYFRGRYRRLHFS